MFGKLVKKLAAKGPSPIKKPNAHGIKVLMSNRPDPTFPRGVPGGQFGHGRIPDMPLLSDLEKTIGQRMGMGGAGKVPSAAQKKKASATQARKLAAPVKKAGGSQAFGAERGVSISAGRRPGAADKRPGDQRAMNANAQGKPAYTATKRPIKR